MLKPFGGELPIKDFIEQSFFTDSGRSSLLLFIRSIGKDTKFLIPDFLCPIIVEILTSEQVLFDYYHIKKDLSIDEETVNNKNFEVFYCINYFGQLQNLENLDIKNKILVEDNVFLYNFENRQKHSKWFAFNSFRKISPLSDGSLIKTNIKINDKLIDNKGAPFSEIKYAAKFNKQKFLEKEKVLEKDYLLLFERGEELLNNQSSIYTISNRSLYLLFSLLWKKMNTDSKRNFYIFLKETNIKPINLNTEWYSFFVFYTEQRDSLIEYLAQNNFFIPVHWRGNKNSISSQIISIPIFNTYEKSYLEQLSFLIKSFYERNNRQ